MTRLEPDRIRQWKSSKSYRLWISAFNSAPLLISLVPSRLRYVLWPSLSIQPLVSAPRVATFRNCHFFFFPSILQLLPLPITLIIFVACLVFHVISLGEKLNLQKPGNRCFGTITFAFNMDASAPRPDLVIGIDFGMTCEFLSKFAVFNPN